jgi:diguanylate cyclase (GGDEF)-like protein
VRIVPISPKSNELELHKLDTAMTNAPRLLDKLVSMTAIHDVELMEFSLLKTLEEFLRPQELLILKLDQNGRPSYQLRLRQEKYEIVLDSITLSDEILATIEIVRSTKRSFNRPLNSNLMLTVWHVFQEKSHEIFLVTITSSQITKQDAYMIKGLLGIYRNFFTVLSDSQRDQLTGLFNRKTFDDVINKIYFQRPLSTEAVLVERRCKNDIANPEFWIGMADLDNFKRINDTWGHLYGDEVLLLMSQLMQGHFRENDHLFRFGGEEFVIIIRTKNEEQAHSAFERFRVAMESHPFPQVGQVTVSIGVAKMCPNIFSATLLDHADKALYHAKQNGRNQVCFYEELVDNGLIEETAFTSGEIELF